MTGHYFTNSPDLPDDRREVVATVWGTERSYVTSGGVFSANSLDKATDVLLQHTEPPVAGTTVLDLGCGWGVIACNLAASGAETWAVDVNDRALELTRANAERHGLKVQACLPDQVPAEVSFDFIWSNPPIRIGKNALHDLLLTWLPKLKPSGEAFLVIGKNLGADSLHRWLEEQGFGVRRITSSKGFRVLAVRTGR